MLDFSWCAVFWYISCLLNCSKNTITYTHGFALYRLSLFNFNIFSIYTLATVTLLMVGFHWNKVSGVSMPSKINFLKETFFTLQNLIVLSIVMFKKFGRKLMHGKASTCNSCDFIKSLLLIVSDIFYSSCAWETLFINFTHFWLVIKSIMGDLYRNNLSLSKLV